MVRASLWEDASGRGGRWGEIARQGDQQSREEVTRAVSIPTWSHHPASSPSAATVWKYHCRTSAQKVPSVTAGHGHDSNVPQPLQCRAHDPFR